MNCVLHTLQRKRLAKMRSPRVGPGIFVSSAGTALPASSEPFWDENHRMAGRELAAASLHFRHQIHNYYDKYNIQLPDK